jgi:hypothetical protein
MRKNKKDQAMGIHSMSAIIFNCRYLVTGGLPAEGVDKK